MSTLQKNYNFTKPLPFPIIRITKPIVYTKNKTKNGNKKLVS